MHPSHFAYSTPERICAIFPQSDTNLTYGELEKRANQGARLLRQLGLSVGDSVVFCLPNDPIMLEATCAAQRIGLYFTPCPVRSSAREISYLVEDSGAQLVLVGVDNEPLLTELNTLLPSSVHRYTVGCAHPAYARWDYETQGLDTARVPDPVNGEVMLYSSGTTGQPKGIKRPLQTSPYGSPDNRTTRIRELFGNETVFLATSPLYHSAPYRYMSGMLATGGTQIIMNHFDPEEALRLIETHRVTHSIWVPTMFTRLLSLPEQARQRYDLSSMKHAIHGAAPCPPSVKRAMIDWWGPILFEYYAGTEGVGMCSITSEEWLKKPGSVGRPISGKAHILNDEFQPLPPENIGTIYFESPPNFVYHNTPDKTKAIISPQGWSTYGDIGYLDEEGYLFLTDRKAYMIITGGVNVYPQEVENVLMAHPDIVDCAVFGIPHPDFGEQVQAVVQMREGYPVGAETEQQLIKWCRSQLSGVKCPKAIDFSADMPRDANGKLYKMRLQEAYLARPGIMRRQ